MHRTDHGSWPCQINSLVSFIVSSGLIQRWAGCVITKPIARFIEATHLLLLEIGDSSVVGRGDTCWTNGIARSARIPILNFWGRSGVDSAAVGWVFRNRLIEVIVCPRSFIGYSCGSAVASGTHKPSTTVPCKFKFLDGIVHSAAKRSSRVAKNSSKFIIGIHVLCSSLILQPRDLLLPVVFISNRVTVVTAVGALTLPRAGPPARSRAFRAGNAGRRR